MLNRKIHVTEKNLQIRGAANNETRISGGTLYTGSSPVRLHCFASLWHCFHHKQTENSLINQNVYIACIMSASDVCLHSLQCKLYAGASSPSLHQFCDKKLKKLERGPFKLRFYFQDNIFTKLYFYKIFKTFFLFYKTYLCHIVPTQYDTLTLQITLSSILPGTTKV